MAVEDIFNIDYRNHVIKQIISDENTKRKQESLKRFEIYNDRLEEYVYNVLQRNLSQETLDEMRVMSAINLVPRIINEQSSIYTHMPERQFFNTDERVDELMKNLYKFGRVNHQLKMSNRYLNLQDQCAIQVIPKDGVIKLKVLQPHHFDVIPNSIDPSKADVYILSQYDKDKLFDRTTNQNNVQPQPSGVEYRTRDRMNQSIGDESDWKSRQGFYVWWTDLFNFTTDEKGNILDPRTGRPFADGTLTDEMLPLIINPIETLPFIDVKEETDFEYWQRYGNSTVDFSIQMATILSDTAEVNRLQGFAQPIISATEPPQDMKVGANTVMFLKKSKNADAAAQPSFEFASPNPDLQGSIEVIRTYLSMFLTSKGLDPSVVTAEGVGGARFSSGIDRLLANIEKFEASQDQFEMFKWIELKVFKLFRKWLDAFSGVTDGGLIDELAGIIPEDVTMDIKYNKPSDNISEGDRYDLMMKKVEDGSMSMVELIMQDREIGEDEAREVLENIREDRDERLGLTIGDRDANAFGQEPEAED